MTLSFLSSSPFLRKSKLALCLANLSFVIINKHIPLHPTYFSLTHLYFTAIHKVPTGRRHTVPYCTRGPQTTLVDIATNRWGKREKRKKCYYRKVAGGDHGATAYRVNAAVEIKTERARANREPRRLGIFTRRPGLDTSTGRSRSKQKRARS